MERTGCKINQLRSILLYNLLHIWLCIPDIRGLGDGRRHLKARGHIFRSLLSSQIHWSAPGDSEKLFTAVLLGAPCKLN